MLRFRAFVCVLTLVLLTSPAPANAQGWGWEGWGGWTTTPETAFAQGMGHYYTGAGIFEEKTAIAHSINADTLMRWNDYIFQANQEAARRYVARRRENSANNRAQNEAIISRILRFGQATTPIQRTIYRDLYAQIDAVRRQVVRSPANGSGASVLSNLNPVFDFFSNLFQ